MSHPFDNRADDALVQKLVGLSQRLACVTKAPASATQTGQRILSLETHLQREQQQNKKLHDALRAKRLISLEAVDDGEVQLLLKSIYAADLKRTLSETPQFQCEEQRRQMFTKNDEMIRENSKLKSETEALRRHIQTNESGEAKHKKSMSKLQKQRSDLIGELRAKEENVRTLTVEIEELKTANGQLEVALKDRDSLHRKVLKNKESYESALAQLLIGKKEQSELESALRAKMIAHSRVQQDIEALRETKTQLHSEMVQLKQSSEQQISELQQNNSDEMGKLKKTLRYRQDKYDETKRTHQNLRDNILSNAACCGALTAKIQTQKDLFAQKLKDLVETHSKELQALSKDTQQMKQVLAMTRPTDIWEPKATPI